MVLVEYFCHKCRKQLAVDEHPCSKCGCDKRDIYAYPKDTISVEDTLLRGKLKRPNIPGDAYEIKNIKKISGETKRPTKETMIIDRTHPEKTVKKHIVEEWDGEKWIRCHDELEENKAKHRRKNDND